MVIVFDSCLASGGLVPRVEMDIHEFLGANYGDLFDPPECNFDLQDSLNNDWLENIFSSSSSSLSPSSSSSISSSTPAPMTGIDDLLPGSTSPDSVHYEHSYSMGSCDSSPSLDSWHSSTDKGDPFEFLRDLCPPIFDLGCDMVEETPARVKEEDGLDLDPQWMESSSSSSPSSCGEVTETAAPSPPVERQTKKSIVLLTDEAGQTMTFTSEETNNSSSSSSHNNNNNEELILVDWNYEDQDEKDPIDLSMYRGKLIPFSNGKKDGPTVIHQAATGLTVTTFSSPWQKQEVRNASRSFTLTEALFSNPVPTEGQLLLTDEEKNTLVAEGYPVPTKLPLGKAEEKYLKKIRRKIKNKISAQESRRKKKEYMDHLELKMHKYCQENTELMKKVEHLEGNNRQLLVQLRNIQKILKVTGSVSTTGGTSLMVLVLFFAAFIGSWSPISWSIGYGRLATVSMIGSGGDQVSVAAVGGAGGGLGGVGAGGQPMPCAPFIGPDLQHPMVDVYSTLSRRSRLLMSTKDEEDAYNDSSSSSLLFGPTIPASYIQTLAYWFSSVTGGKMMEKDEGEQKAAEEGDGVDDWGFTVKHILPLTQRHMIFKETPTTLTSNETFRLPLLSKSQPNPPFPVADKAEQLQMER